MDKLLESYLKVKDSVKIHPSITTFMGVLLAKLKRIYWRSKIAAAFIAASNGILIGLQFMYLAPAPFNLCIPIVTAVLFALFVWFVL